MEDVRSPHVSQEAARPSSKVRDKDEIWEVLVQGLNLQV